MRQERLSPTTKKRYANKSEAVAAVVINITEMKMVSEKSTKTEKNILVKMESKVNPDALTMETRAVLEVK